MPLIVHGCGFNGFSQLDDFKSLHFNESGLIKPEAHCTRIKNRRNKVPLPEELVQLNNDFDLHCLLVTWPRVAATFRRGTCCYTSVITGLRNIVQDETDLQSQPSILDGQVVMATTDSDILVRGFEETVPNKIVHEKNTQCQPAAVIFPSQTSRLQIVNGGHKDFFAVYDASFIGKLHISETEASKDNEETNTKEYPEVINCDLHSVGSGIEVKEVSCGKEHVLILTHIGTVYSYGLGSRGQLGHYNVEPETSPRLLAALEGLRMTSICAGGWHSASVSECGDLYMWGWNESGQLGVPAMSSSSQIAEDEERIGIQTEPLCVTGLPDELNIVAVGCGSRHSVILSDTGRVFTCGWNAYGQLGLSDTESRDRFTEVLTFKNHCVRIFAGQWNSFFLSHSINNKQ